MAAKSLHNLTRPQNYKCWLSDVEQPISSSTLRSRATAEQRKRRLEETIADEDNSGSGSARDESPATKTNEDYGLVSSK